MIADSHIIGPLYRGPEGSPEDTESIFRNSDRLTAARDFLNKLRPAPQVVFLVGDYLHNYPSPDIDFYFQNETGLDLAKKITDGFRVPVRVGFGNHDYAVLKVSRDVARVVSPQVQFEAGLFGGTSGWRFVHLNNFLGDTWKAGAAH